MIHPSHECSWTHHKKLNLSVRSGELYCGGGCAEAVLYGFRDCDVMIVIEGSREDCEAWVVERNVGEQLGVAEGNTQQVLAMGNLNLPVVLIQDAPPAWLNDIPFLAKLQCHDNCFFRLTTADDAVIQGAVDGLLRLLSSYFEFEIDWSAANNKILSLSYSVQGIALQCDVDRNRVEISDAKKRLLLPRRKSAMISVAGGTATVLC